jgi:putative PIN family toxin of toxin-antitoxin system
MNKYYIDTCVWLDLIEKREPFIESTNKFIQKIISKSDLILYSDYVIEELGDKMSLEKFSDFLKKTNNSKIKLEKENISSIIKLMREFNLSFGDTVHLFLVLKSNSILVTRDTDFMKVSHLIKILNPRDLY